MQLAIEVITAIRNLKVEVKIASAQAVKVTLVAKDKKVKSALDTVASYITNLGRVEDLTIQGAPAKLKKGISAIVHEVQVFLELEGLLDIDKEIERLTKEADALTGSLKSKESRLKNKDFLKKAPEEIVDKEKESLAQGQEKLASLQRVISELKK